MAWSAVVHDVAEITREIDADLPEIARRVITMYLDVDLPVNGAFLRNPDGREHHQTHWHQWGIITHTRMFLRHYDVDVPNYLRTWGMWEPVRLVLDEQIDGVDRRDLLRISILLHDIGKFAARTQGKRSFHFARHEQISGDIIRDQSVLTPYGLSSDQIEYIALTAEDHFVLGLMRKRAREEGVYDEQFTETDEFRRLAADIRSAHPRDYVEIGVLFLGDSLAKADPATGPAQAVSQYDVNIAVARRYLESVLGGPSL